MENNVPSLLYIDKNAIQVVESNKISNIKRLLMYLALPFLVLAILLWIFELVWLCAISFIVFIGCAIIFLEKGEMIPVRLMDAKLEKLNQILTSIDGFNTTKRFINEEFHCAIAIDVNANNLCIVDQEIRIFRAKDIIEVEIVENEVQVTKTSRGGQLGGAIVGGVLAGGVGAMIGGLSGNKKTSNDEIKQIYLKVVLNDTERPYFTFNFLNEINEISKKEKKAIEAIENANQCYSFISLMIKRADQLEEKQQSGSMDSKSPISVADELMKLSELLKQDVLTQEEFEIQKKKLLGV